MKESGEVNISLGARLLVLFAPPGYLLYYLLQGRFLLLGNTDHVDAQLPFLFAAKDALTLGQLPWWNPNIFNGAPLWGSTGIFLWYPPTWLELLAPHEFTLYLSTFISWLHYGGVFLAGFLYFRVLIGDEKWASFSALAYGFSISVAYGLSVGNAYLPVYVFLPLALYFLHSQEQRSHQKNIIYLTIALYFMITGGFLQFLIYAMAILGSYVLFLAFQSNSRKQAFSLIGIFAVALFIAILLSAPSWISTSYMAGLVSRVSADNGVLQSILNGGYTTPLDRWLRLFMPNGFGFAMWVHPISYVETIVAFCGVSCLFLAGIAIICTPRKIVFYWTGFVLLCLLLVSSKLVILQYYAFGGVEIMYGRLLFLLPLGVAGLAGIGGKSLSETHIPRWKLLLFNPFNILLAVAILSNRRGTARIFLNALSTIQEFYLHQAIAITAANLPGYEFIRAGIVILVLLLALAFLKGRKMPFFWLIATALLLIEVVPSTYLMNKVQVNRLMISPSTSFFAFDQVEVPLPFSRSDLEKFRLVITEKTPSRKEDEAPAFAKESNQGSVYGYQSPWGYANGYSTNLSTLIQTVGAMDLDPDCGSKGLIHGNKDILYNASRQVMFDPLCHPRLSDLTSIGAVLGAGRKWSIVDDRRGTTLPRASLFYEYEVIPDSVEAATRLAQDVFDIHKTLILEKNPPLAAGPADPEARSVFVKNTPNEVVIEVHSNTPAFLLLTDTFSPGWEAELDGQPAEIIRSNVAFRSVWLPKGDHIVTFRYHPPLLPLSLVVTFLGLLSFLGVMASSKVWLAKLFPGHERYS